MSGMGYLSLPYFSAQRGSHLARFTMVANIQRLTGAESAVLRHINSRYRPAVRRISIIRRQAHMIACVGTFLRYQHAIKLIDPNCSPAGETTRK